MTVWDHSCISYIRITLFSLKNVGLRLVFRYRLMRTKMISVDRYGVYDQEILRGKCRICRNANIHIMLNRNMESHITCIN
jgi:hypothetical protein